MNFSREEISNFKEGLESMFEQGADVIKLNVKPNYVKDFVEILKNDYLTHIPFECNCGEYSEIGNIKSLGCSNTTAYIEVRKITGGAN